MCTWRAVIMKYIILFGKTVALTVAFKVLQAMQNGLKKRTELGGSALVSIDIT